jgi:hypothetical protein
VNTEEREAVLAEWLKRTLSDYPAATSRFLAREKDPFRNPVGQAFRDALPLLLDAVLDGKPGPRVDAALDDVMRIRAVQEFTASQAVAFLFLLKPIVRDPAANERIDVLALRAFDLYMQCREKIWEIQARQAAGIPVRHS